MKAALIILLIIAVVVPAFAESLNEYTIELGSFDNIDSATSLADRVSEKMGIPVTLEKEEISYIVRAGKAATKSDLIPYLNALKKSGFNNAVIVSLPSTKRHVLFALSAGVSAGTASGYGRKSNILSLTQERQNSGAKVASPDQETVEQSLGSDVLSESKSTQSNLIGVTRKEQEGTGRVTSPDQAAGKLSYDDAARYLALGWKGYKAGLYGEALKYFGEAEKNTDTLAEARLGAAYSYIKLGRKADAAPLLEEVVGQNYQTSETLPSLINLLIEMKDYEGANIYISRLSPDEKEIWRKKIEKSRSRPSRQSALSAQFENAEKTGDIGTITSLAARYRSALDGCREPWVFYKSARFLGKSNRADDAEKIYYSLLSACPDEWDMRIAVFYELKPLLSYSNMRKLIDSEMTDAQQPPEYREQLTKLKFDVLKEQLVRVSDDRAVSSSLVREILAIDPQDPDALSSEAWEYYNAKNYSKAYDIFSYLHTRYAENDDYILGLIYSLIGLGEEDHALRLLNDSGVAGETKTKVETQIYLSMGNKLYQQKNYTEAQKPIEKALEIDPQNTDAESLLAWTLYNLGKYDRALGLFMSVYERKKEAKIAEAILNTYDQLGDHRNGIRFGYQAGLSGDDSLLVVSGTYFSSHDMPITAAQINPDPAAPYYNSDKMSADFQPQFGHRTGQSGISELSTLSFPVTLSRPFKWGNNIRFSFDTQWLYSGAAPSSPFVGTAPLGRPQIRSLINSLWVFTPEISFEREGYININFDVGTTPLNGPVFPLPTFALGLNQEWWRLRIHQDPVTESILSYVGLEDPYSGRDWGRVLRTGAEAEINVQSLSPYWLTVIAGYDYYWGDNVKGNNSVNGTISTGRTVNTKFFDYSVGAFLTMKHFERNSNFFTFGQGGYFSPDVFLMTGPTLGIKTKTYKSYYINVDATVGYLYFRTEDSPYLPLGNNDSIGKFKGESTSRVGYDFNLEALKLLTPHTALGVYGGINQSADFTEWTAGLTFRFYRSPRNELDITKRSEPW